MKQKILFLLFLVSISATTVQAQLKGFSFGPYLEAAWPKGDFEKMNSNGIGAGFTADLKLAPKVSLTGSAGYLRFGRRSTGTGSAVITAVPLRLGVKYKLPIVYLKMETGTARMNGDHGSALIISPGAGFRILGLDVQGSYESWLGEEGRSFASLKIAYHF